MKTKLVIFDLDNTLYDYDTCHERALRTALEHTHKLCSVPISELYETYQNIRRILKKKIGVTASSHNRFIYFANICRQHSISANYVCDIDNLYWDTYLSNMRPFHGASNLLQSLKSAGVFLVVLSDFQIRLVHHKLRVLNLLQFFDGIYSSEEFGVEKPNSDGFIQILKDYNMRPEQCLMIGDSFDKDIEGARRVGIRGVLLRNDFSNVITLNENYVSYSSLGAFFSNLNNL
jgi:HAD superfamily hydrolase (TIGR01509 family)